MKLFLKPFILLCLTAASLWGDVGISQAHLVEIAPSSGSIETVGFKQISISFDRHIVSSSLKPKSMRLQALSANNEEIAGETILKEKRLLFVPNQKLEAGLYRITLSALELKPNETGEEDHFGTLWDRFVDWVYSWFDWDEEDTSVSASMIETIAIESSFELKEPKSALVSLKASETEISLSEENQSEISITATYADGKHDDVTSQAKYESDSDEVSIEKGQISSHDESHALITVSYQDKTLQLTVDVYEKIEGHLLPHAPKDPDSTLLGVDSNDNGIRDDVERWIYKEMTTYHHPEIERIIAMQDSKAYQVALADPSNKDDKGLDIMMRGLNCWAHYSFSRDLPTDGRLVEYSNAIKDQQFNTKKRLKTYIKFDYNLGGRVYTLTPLRLLNTSYCDSNIDILP